MSPNPNRLMQTLLDRAQRRFIRARAGSVLILVVALLVLMALIGTAYMTMAQFDRGSAVTHSFNTEVDLLLDGVINQVKGTISNDIFPGGQFRGAEIVQTSTGQAVTYNVPLYNASPRYWNGLGLDPGLASALNEQAGDWWLASRVPGLPQDRQAAPYAVTPWGAGTINNVPMWPFITGPINGGATFDQPYWAPKTTQAQNQYTLRNQLYPTVTGGFTNVSTPFTIDGQAWPAWGAPGTANWFMAADADGDGIADSGLVKLLTLDGVTYYGAVRIVDNGGAINASIAQTPNPIGTYTPGTSMPGDLSPVNLDLEGMTVNPGSTFGSWNAPFDLYGQGPTATYSATGPGLLYNWRFHGYTDSTTPRLSSTPLTDGGLARNDFAYMPYPFSYPGSGGTVASVNYYFDQQWSQLGRRLRNPGPVVPTATYQALPTSETLTMARNFIVRDPTVLSSATSPSVLEMLMPNSTFLSPYGYPNGNSVISTSTGLSAPYQYPTAPYQPGNTTNWFLQNFYYWYDFDPGRTGGSQPPAGTPTMPIRALLTAQSPLSNFAPGRFNPNPLATNYQFGDIVTDAKGYKYVCICPSATGFPPSNSTLPSNPFTLNGTDLYWSDPCWAWEPWTDAPTKTSVNTATFQQLYAAYWGVMADQYVAPTLDPNGQVVTPGQWYPEFTASTTPTAPSWIGRRMFRSPIRGNAIGGSANPPNPAEHPLSSQQVMQLRAALAAINTMGLRNPDGNAINFFGTNDVISRNIYLPATTGGGTNMMATVYSTERQPYITQVFAQNDPTAANAWMAIDLYNPYDRPIKLTNWLLATANRTTLASATGIGPLAPIGSGNLQRDTPSSPLLEIEPNEHVVLVTSDPPPATIKLTKPAPVGTPPVTVRFIPVTGLSSAFGKELILMRPRRADGLLLSGSQGGAAANNFYQEKDTLPNDLVPVDSYDFTNLKQTNGTPQQWWYIRPSDASKPWHFVFPGPWMLPASASSSGPAPSTAVPTWSGTFSMDSPTNPVGISTLGLGQTSTSPTGQTVSWASYSDCPIQVANIDFGSVKPKSGGPNSLPLGGFPRNGDILQVTFTGSYKLFIPTSPLPNDLTTYDPNTEAIYEINPITADTAMATAADQSDIGATTPPVPYPLEPIVSNSSATPQIVAENVGRFCPIDHDDATLAGWTAPDDFALPTITPVTPPAPPTPPAPNIGWMYHWTTRLFDFVTVQSPHDDYFPDVDPWRKDPNYVNYTTSGASDGAPIVYRYAMADVSGPPLPVANVTPVTKNAGLQPPSTTPPASGISEDTTPLDGLVNINTAPWRVLAAVPWYPATTANYRQLNAQLAVALAHYRDIDDSSAGDGTGHPHGPFRNLFELGEAKINGQKLRDILAGPPPVPPAPSTASCNTAQFTAAQGNLAPLSSGTLKGPVPGDFQAQFNTITRLSNLITTRSDSYTAYILIQGWRNAETPNPHLVVQRRAAIILDRSVVTPNNRMPNVTNVPQ